MPHGFVLVRAGLARRFRQSRPVSAFFCTVLDRIATGTSNQIPGRTALFSCAPENLVTRDGFGSPVPRQFFFCTVRDRIDTGTSDKIPDRTALFLDAPENLVSRDGFGSPVLRQLCFVPSEIGSTQACRYTERAIISRVARLLYQCNAPVKKTRAIYPVLDAKTKTAY